MKPVALPSGFSVGAALGCPRCGSSDGDLFLGRLHFQVCTVHQSKWLVGVEPPAYIQEQDEKWSSFEDVCPVLSRELNVYREDGTLFCRLRAEE